MESGAGEDSGPAPILFSGDTQTGPGLPVNMVNIKFCLGGGRRMDVGTMGAGIFTLLFFTGFSAGFVDSIAGGGGLVSLPVLLALGLPPQVALGTNKLQGSFGSFSAAWNYVRNGGVNLGDARQGIVCTLVGAVTGAWLVQRLDPDLIKHVIPFLLLFVFLHTLFSKNLGYTDRKPLLSRGLFFALFGILLGFYDGFFGPGTGSFWTAALMVVGGFNMTRATGFCKIMNFTSNIVALGLFWAGGNVLVPVGLAMATGQVLGARAGSNLAIKKGTGFIRPVFMTVVFLTIVRIVYVNYVKGI